VGIEDKFSPGQSTRLSGEDADSEEFIQYAYQDYFLANMAIAEGDYEKAETFLRQALGNDKNSAYLLKKLSQVLVQNEKTEEALYLALKAADLEPDDIEAKELLAEIYSGINKIDPAILQYEEILKKNPEHKEARLYLSTLLIRARQYDRALKELSILMESEPKMMIAYYYAGRVNMELKEYEKAEEAFLKVIEDNPNFLPAFFDLATLYVEIDKIDLAIETYNKLIYFHPANMAARERLIGLYYNTGQKELAEKHMDSMGKILGPDDLERKRLGLIYLMYGKLNEAVAELTSILDTWPNDQEARYYLAVALEENEDPKGAYKNFETLDSDSNYFINARIRMAYILEKQERDDEAIHLLKETIPHKKEEPRLYLTLSSLYEFSGEYHSALDSLNEGLKYNEKNTDLLYRLGVVLDKLDKNEECIKHMEMVIEIDPQHADALNYIGYTYAEMGVHLDKAQELIEKALRHKPETGYIIDSLGWVYFKKGKYDKALVELQKAVELTPEDPAISEHLGDVYFKKKNYEMALEVYNKAISLKSADQERLKKKIENTMEHLKGNVP
jgi:tetratricopeptide (TPR) repeat protein